MGNIFSKEPAVIIASVAAAITGIALTLSGNGFISDALAGKVVDLAEAGRQIALLVLPFLGAGITIRSQVYAPATVSEIVSDSVAVPGVVEDID